MNASKVVLSGSTVSALSSALKSQDKNEAIWLKASDSLRADRVTSTMLETEKKGGSEDLRQQVKAVILSTFTEAEKGLIAADPKSLDDMKKFQRKTAQQKIGARLALIQSFIKKAEKAEEDGEAEAPKTAVQRIHADLDKAIAKLQKLDAPSFVPLSRPSSRPSTPSTATTSSDCAKTTYMDPPSPHMGFGSRTPSQPSLRWHVRATRSAAISTRMPIGKARALRRPVVSITAARPAHTSHGTLGGAKGRSMHWSTLRRGTRSQSRTSAPSSARAVTSVRPSYARISVSLAAEI
jgi:hypothetical protein